MGLLRRQTGISRVKRSPVTAAVEAKTRENGFRKVLDRHQASEDRIGYTIPTVYSGDGVVLTSTQDIVDGWKEYFKDLLYPTNAPAGEKARPGDSEVAKVVKKLTQRPGGG